MPNSGKVDVMTDKRAESLAKGFREFGYDTVTAAEVKQIWNDIQKGVANDSDPVVIMLADAAKGKAL